MNTYDAPWRLLLTSAVFTIQACGAIDNSEPVLVVEIGRTYEETTARSTFQIHNRSRPTPVLQQQVDTIASSHTVVYTGDGMALQFPNLGKSRAVFTQLVWFSGVLYYVEVSVSGEIVTLDQAIERTRELMDYLVAQGIQLDSDEEGDRLFKYGQGLPLMAPSTVGYASSLDELSERLLNPDIHATHADIFTAYHGELEYKLRLVNMRRLYPLDGWKTTREELRRRDREMSDDERKREEVYSLKLGVGKPWPRYSTSP